MDINIKEQKIVSNIGTKKGDIVYDFGDDDGSAENLPDASVMLDHIIVVLEYMNTDDMKSLRGKDKTAFEEMMEQKFPLFAEEYYSVFKMVISGQDLTPLFKMLEIIGEINKGDKSFEEGEKNIGGYLNKFLPSDLLEKIEKGELDVPNDKSKSKKKKNKK